MRQGLWMKKWKVREVEGIAQVSSASRCWLWDLNPGHLAPDSVLLINVINTVGP